MRGLAVALLALAACSRAPVAGVVVEKRHEEAHTEEYMEPMMVGRSVIFLPREHHVPEAWVLVVRGEDGECRRAAVSQEAWDGATPGDWYGPPH